MRSNNDDASGESMRMRNWNAYLTIQNCKVLNYMEVTRRISRSTWNVHKTIGSYISTQISKHVFFLLVIRLFLFPISVHFVFKTHHTDVSNHAVYPNIIWSLFLSFSPRWQLEWLNKISLIRLFSFPIYSLLYFISH